MPLKVWLAVAAKLQLYSVNAVTEGTDSQGGVTVRLEKDGRIINGQGADTDILVASAKAYLNALTLMRNPGAFAPTDGRYLMQPSQQAYYLQTLGIVQYVPKDAVLLVDEVACWRSI